VWQQPVTADVTCAAAVHCDGTLFTRCDAAPRAQPAGVPVVTSEREPVL